MSSPRLKEVLRPAVEASVEARLALTEHLLGSFDFTDCAQRALDWLGEHAGIERALFVAPDTDGTQLIGIAGHRVPASRVSAYIMPLDGSDHPVAAAMEQKHPVVVSGPRIRHEGSGAPLGPHPYLAVPLIGRRERDEGRAGVLLLQPSAPRAMRTVQWVAELLSQKLLHLRSQGPVADARRRLARERTLLDNIINAVTDPILLTDAEGRLITANTRAEALFAATENESEGRRRAVALNNMLLSAALSQQAIGETEPTRRELLLVDPEDGTDLLFELLSTVIAGPRERARMISILRNVTDLRRATQEIEENYRKLRVADASVRDERDRLNLIIDSVADPILVTDPSGAIVMMNSPAENLFIAELDGSSEEAQRAVRANDARFSSFVANLFFGGPGVHRRREFSLFDPHSGSEVPFEAISGTLLSQHGEVTGVVTILHDRTEAIDKARLYEQLKRASDQLEEKVHDATQELVRQNELLRLQHIQLEHASALKSQFLANMSHEFRTPLNAIMGYTVMLLEGVGGTLRPAQTKQLTRIDSNAKHLLAIMNDLLDISRIEAGKMPLHLTEFELEALLSEVMTEAEPIIAASKLEVSRAVPDDLPVLRSDRQRVKQIVLNLLSNAIKFTSQGSVKIRAWHDEAQDLIAIAVADTGVGIPEKEQEKVFEAFSQVDNSPTRQYGGAGLGLTICRHLSEMLGGHITLESKLGNGSTFTLLLPRRMRLK